MNILRFLLVLSTFLHVITCSHGRAFDENYFLRWFNRARQPIRAQNQQVLPEKDEDVDRQEAEDIEGIWRSDARRKGTKLKYIDLKKEIHFPDYEQKQSRGFRAFNTDLLGPPLVVENDYSNHDANFPDDSEEDTNKS